MVTTGAANWSLVGEISSASLRHYTTGFSAGIGNVLGLGIGYLVPYMINTEEWNWGLKSGWFFFGCGLPVMIVLWLYVPETKK